MSWAEKFIARWDTVPRIGRGRTQTWGPACCCYYHNCVLREQKKSNRPPLPTVASAGRDPDILQFCGRLDARTVNIAGRRCRLLCRPQGVLSKPPILGTHTRADREYRRSALQTFHRAPAPPLPRWIISRLSVVDCLGEHPETHSFRSVPGVHHRRLLRGPAFVAAQCPPDPRELSDALTLSSAVGADSVVKQSSNAKGTRCQF